MTDYLSTVFFAIIALLIVVPRNSAGAEEKVERYSVISKEPVLSVDATLLFEQKVLNDEGVEVLGAPRVESREVRFESPEEARWNISVILRDEDRKHSPTLSCIVQLINGQKLVLPNRLITQESSNADVVRVGVASCQRITGGSSAEAIHFMSADTKREFIRSGMEESKRLSEELTGLLTEETSKKLFDLEKKYGLAPARPIGKDISSYDLARRLIILESVRRQQQ